MRSFLCQVVIFFTLLSIGSCQRCPKGWLTFQQSCFKIIADEGDRTAFEAGMRCDELGGSLVSIPNTDVNTYLATHLPTNVTLADDYWIGLYGITGEATFVWVDGTPLDDAEAAWQTGQPDNVGGSEDCVKLRRQSGLWTDDPCSGRAGGIICQTTANIPIACDEGNMWEAVNDKCLKYYSSAKSWQEAEAFCAQVGGTLVMIEDAVEQDYVTGRSGDGHVWIGLSDINNEVGDYRWTNNRQALSYNNWKSGEPDNSHVSGNCVEVRSNNNGQWSTQTCSSENAFICSKREGRCSAGWKISRASCYQFNTYFPSTWTDAKHTCDAQGGHLVTINDREENEFLISEFAALNRVGITDLWIGISDTGDDGVFLWADGVTTSVPYTKWNEGQPQDTVGQPDCGSVYAAGYSGPKTWRDDGRCGVDYPLDDGETPAECHPDSYPCCSRYGWCGITDAHCLCPTCIDFTDTYDLGRWNTKNCFMINHFICEIAADQPVKEIPPNIGVGSCDNDWQLHGDYCYYFGATPETFQDASDACQLLNSELVSILDADEQSFISGRLRYYDGDLWIGLHDVSNEGNFEWLDGSTLEFTNWAVDEPNNYGEGEDCVEIYRGEDKYGEWNDQDCFLIREYVCKKRKYNGGFVTEPVKPTPVFDPKCGSGYEYHASSSTCYKFVTDGDLTWEDAENQCRKGGGHLLSISGLLEEYYITARLYGVNTPELWIGANDRTVEGGWTWSDGSAFAYLNWGPGQPNNYDHGYTREDCSEIVVSTGQWNDDKCDRTSGYICKNKGILVDYFNVYHDAALEGHNNKHLNNVYPKDCAQRCLDETSFTCRSFDYHKVNLACDLSSSDKSSAGGLKTDYPNNPYDHYEVVARPVDIATTLAPGSRCSNGWYGYGSYCYFLETSMMSWIDARDGCRQLGGDLVSIHDDGENSFVLSMVLAGPDGKVWIGLNDLSRQMSFEWTDGSDVTYTRWSDGQPNNSDGNNEDCANILTDSNAGYWNDGVCSKDFMSVCKKPKEVLPPTTAPVNGDCEVGWIGIGISCYKFNTSPTRSWSVAQSTCQTWNANLVSINDNVEQSFLSSKLSTVSHGESYWIGLTDLNRLGNYYWIDGAPVTYSNWANNQPDTRTGDCVAISSTGVFPGLWSGLSCVDQLPYICEKLKYGNTPETYTIAPSNPSNLGCGNEWIGYGDKCFKPFRSSGSYDRKTWSEAEDYCINLGGHLASFHNNEEEAHVVANSDIKNYFEQFWIGLNDRAEETGFVWSDGSAVSYINWGNGEPNDVNNEDCVEMYFSTQSPTGSLWNDNRCGKKFNWVCQIQRGVVPITPSPQSSIAPPTRSTTSCGGLDGYILYDNACYYFSKNTNEEKKSWTQARQFCKQQSGELVSVHSVDEQRFIHQTIDANAWMGLREYMASSTYSWSDSTPFNYINWAFEEPNDSNGEEQCVEVRAYDGSWNDMNCGDKLSFICKKPIGVTAMPSVMPTPPHPGNCPADFWVHGNKCYSFNGANEDDVVTWHDARTRCRNAGGDLATIHSQELQAYLASNLRDIKYSMWIGLSDTVDEGQYRWTDGTVVDFYKWAPGEPNGGDQENCVEMHFRAYGGWWNDVSCSSTGGYICQASKSLSNPAPPPTTNPCKAGYVAYWNGCYKLLPGTYTFGDARSACLNEEADLVSIEDVYEQSYVEMYVAQNQKPLWIGMNDQTIGGTYKWTDGSPVFYTNWGDNEPNKDGGEGCVRMELSGDWTDTSCSSQTLAMCKYYIGPRLTTPVPGAGICPQNASWTAYGDFCYNFDGLLTRMSWPESSHACKNMGGDLLTIGSQEENEYIRQVIREIDRNMWIGLTRVGSGGFAWIDNGPVSYTNWAPNEPTPADPSGEYKENCVEMYFTSGEWNDVDCLWDQIGYACKIPKIKSGVDRQVGSDTGNTNGGAVAGIVIGIVAAIVVIAVVGYLLYTRRVKLPSLTKSNQSEFTVGFENAGYTESQKSGIPDKVNFNIGSAEA
ncbi:macrophage mannose receptor 1-like [Glandiceps talaboti]